MRGPSSRISKLLILLFISVNLSGAQSKYIKWIKKKQFARTSRNLPKVLKKKADKPIDLMNAYYALAFLKNQRDYKHFSTLSAYQDILMALKCYEDARFMDPKKLAKDDLSLVMLEEYLEIICNNAFVDISQKNTVEDYNNFLNNFSRMSYDLQTKSIKLRDEKAFSSTKTIDTEEAYISFIETYYNSVFINEAISLRNTRAYQKATADNTIAAYENFLARYKNAEQAPFAQARIYEIAFAQAKNKNTAAAFLEFYNTYNFSLQAKEALKLFEKCQFFENTKVGNWDSYVNFKNTYTTSSWSNIANDSIYNIAINQKIPTALKYIIKEEPFYHTLNNITTYYDWISKDGELTTLEMFAEQFPYDYQKIEAYDTDLFLAKLAFELYLTQSLQLIRGAGSLKPTEYGDKYIDYIKRAAPKELAYVALQKVLANDIETKRWKVALKTLKKLKPYFKGSKKVENLEAILSSEYDRSIRAVNLSSINTSGNEYCPVISPNNQTLFFCGRYRYDNDGNSEDVFASFAADNSWSSASLQQTLSSSQNEAITSISSDGNTAISFREGKLGTIKRTINGWSEFKDLPISINTGTWNSDGMISSDNKTLIFSSKREIGYNYNNHKPYHDSNNYSVDIFAVQKDDFGNWGIPINLGDVINTPYSDRSPFLHPDMKTLYFSSDGHGGLGNYDVYKSTRQGEDCWDCWSEPVNMGKEINSIYDDWGYTISTDGNNAYFAKKVKGEDNLDLYNINIPYYLRPDYVATISGKIVGLDGQIIPAEIVWEDLETQTQIGRSQTNPETGEYFIVLPMGKIYGYYIDKDDFFPFSSSLDLREETIAIDVEKNVKIISFEEMIDNQIPVPISNLFFSTGSSRLKRLSFAELDRLFD
ncbi:MAG: hypothetical protein P8O09_07480, partial [Flavobacteriaceae bacterium]|nr:hypothetical protein [Flavobacteriaceae bacterium]